MSSQPTNIIDPNNQPNNNLSHHVGSGNGGRTTASYLRGVFAADQLEWSPANSGKAQQQQQQQHGAREQQPGRGSSERGGAQAKKWELEGHIKKRLSWLNTQQVTTRNCCGLPLTLFSHPGSRQGEGAAEHGGGKRPGDQDGAGGHCAGDGQVQPPC